MTKKGEADAEPGKKTEYFAAEEKQQQQQSNNSMARHVIFPSEFLSDSLIKTAHENHRWKTPSNDVSPLAFRF